MKLVLVLPAAIALGFATSEPAPAVPSLNPDHHCADLLVRTEVEVGVVRGVWDCLEPAVQHMFTGTGDEALAGYPSYFVGDKFLSCDGAMCVYELQFEATTAATTGVPVTTMTVWLDDQGLVSHAAIPKPVP